MRRKSAERRWEQDARCSSRAIVRGALEPSLPPSQDQRPPYVYAPSAIYPVDARERELCEKASHIDWPYLGTLVALDVAAILANSFNAGPAPYGGDPWSGFKVSHDFGVRMLGPVTIGLTWGATVGGGYLALPKCDPNWVGYAPREGQTRKAWPLAAALAGFAAITGPIIMGIATGPLPDYWSIGERTSRLVVTGGFSAIGAVLPYVLSPTTWSAAKEIEKIRAEVTPHGAFLTYSARF